MYWFLFLFVLCFGGSIAGLVLQLQARRHAFKLSMAKETTMQVQAQAQLAEERNRQSALEIRKAELEIERYDRRIPGEPSVS